MRLNPNHSLNFNGFIHPEYLAHLKPLIKKQTVSIDDAVVPRVDALEWAENGLLRDFSVHGGTTSLEALVIKGKESVLVDYIAGLNTKLPEFTWILDYYQDSPEAGIGSLMNAIADGAVLRFQTKLIGAILIQDLGFDQTGELLTFLIQGLRPSAGYSVKTRMNELCLHYISDPDQIRAYERKAESPFHFINCAELWAKSGCEAKARLCLGKAESVADLDFFAFRNISLCYLQLLGDFKMAENARKNQIANSHSLDCMIQNAIDLCLYVATDEAISQGRELMHRAEKYVRAGCDYLELADIWNDFFHAPDRAQECRERCFEYDRKSKGSR